MSEARYGFILLVVTVSIIHLCIIVNMGFLPTGWDTYFHIKYSSVIIKTAKIPTTNPYFPQFAHAYTPGAHALVAVIGLVGGINLEQMPQLFSFLPIIFAIPITIAYYTLALKYMQPKYAIMATFLYYFSSLMHPVMIATNGAPLMNSVVFPYVAALTSFVLFPLFMISVIKFLEQPSILNIIISGIILATITVSYHIMAVVAFGLLLTYIGISFIGGNDRKVYKSLVLIMAFGLLIASPYLLHILCSGIPRETSAMKTYAVLSIMSYVDLIRPVLFCALVLSLLLYLTSKKARQFIRTIPLHRLVILASWMFFLIVATEAYRLGIFLVNDRFAWYLIAPASIIVAMSLMVVEEHIKSVNYLEEKKVLSLIQCLLILGTLFSLVLLPGFQQFFSSSERSKSFLSQELAGIQWLRENALQAVVATSPSTSFVIASLDEVCIIAIPQVMADYYIENLEQRIIDLKTIFGDNLSKSLYALNYYHVDYIYVGKETEEWLKSYDLNAYPLLNAPYFKPVFPLTAFVKETADSYDFDGDGVQETFRTFSWNGTNENSKLYCLTNPDSSTTLILRGLFHKKGTKGPIKISINGVNVAQISSVEEERGQWLTYKIKVPKEILREINKVFIENLDVANCFYLDYIGFGLDSTDKPDQNTVIYAVQYSSSINIGSEVFDINNDGALDIFDNFTENGGYKEYFLYSSFGNETTLTISNLFPETSTTIQVEVYVNNMLVGNLTLTEETLKMKWLTHAITIPEGTLKKGWNTIKFVNVDKNNNWYLSFTQLS